MDVQGWVELLSAEGYRPSIEDDDIRFKAEGLRFRVILDDRDPDFFALSIAFQVGDGHEFGHLAGIANEANEKWKVVKTTVDAGAQSVRFQVESFSPGSATPELLQRSLDALRAAADEFFEELRKAEPEVKA